MDAFLRRYATPLSLVTGLAVSITGIMMFLGLRRGLGEVHEWIGLAFVVALLMHVVRNWRAVLGMMKPWTSKAIVGAIGVALAVLVVAQMPSGGQAAGHGGGRDGGSWLIVNRVSNVPITIAAPALGMTAQEAIAKLKAKGISVGDGQKSLADIAREEDTALPHLFALLLRD